MKQTYNKEAFRSLITLSIPTVLEEVLSTLLQYVDTAMVGHLGEKATAAVSTTTTIGWLIHSIPSAIAVAVLTGFLLSRCVTRTPAFRPVQDSLLWLGTALAAHLLADWLSLPLYIARLCDVGIQESGALSAADGLLILMMMAVFAAGSLGVYAVSLWLTVRRRTK